MRRHFLPENKLRMMDKRNEDSNRINLPEFIPLERLDDNDDGNKHKNPSPQSSVQRHDLSTNYHNTRSTHISTHNFVNNKRRDSRESHVSHKSKESHESNRHSQNSRHDNHSMKRSRSPRRYGTRSPEVNSARPLSTTRESYKEIGQRNDHYWERTTSERVRQSSVFDRMSSPPKPKRRYGESGSSRSNEMNMDYANGNYLSIPRTEQTYFQREEATNNDIRKYHSISPIENVRPYNSDPDPLRVIPRPSITLSTNEYDELRSYRDRLAEFQTHCDGVEATVYTYKREIEKLKLILNDLVHDYNTLYHQVHNNNPHQHEYR